MIATPYFGKTMSGRPGAWVGLTHTVRMPALIPPRISIPQRMSAAPRIMVSVRSPYWVYTPVKVVMHSTRMMANATKNDLFQGLHRAMEESRLAIPADRELREDINAMHRKISTGGNIQFTAPRRPDGHSDRACALALAVDCAERNARRGPIIMPEVLVAPAQFRARRLA